MENEKVKLLILNFKMLNFHFRLKNILILFFTLLLSLLSVSSSFASTDSAQADTVPWSGYWWPMTNGGLATGIDYRGHPAPLEKYELLTQGRYSGELTSWYKAKYYDPSAPGWYGLCGFWAQAACLESGDILPSSENNIIFRVGDKKGLLTLAHENDIAERDYGSRPEVFHYWLLHYIKDQKKPFVADLDPGEQVWSYPIYQYEMQSIRNGNQESVTVRIYYCDDFVLPDFMGSKVSASTYTYDLILDGSGDIIGGEWTGGSITEHPDRLTFPLVARTSCPNLDLEEVRRLAASRDDFLERPGEVVDISPGTYNLILLDQDAYRIKCSPGDQISLLIAKQLGSLKDFTVVVIDGQGAQVERKKVDNGSSLERILSAARPPYTISITQEDYSDPNIYTLTLDLIKAYSQQVPYIPKSGMWSGFALTNPDDTEATGVTLTTSNENGEPVQTLLGPLNLAPGEKRVFFFSDLPYRPHELSSSSKLFLMAAQPVNFLNLFGGTSSLLAGFVQGEAKGIHLIIPDTVPPMIPGKTMFGGVENEGFEQASIALRLFSKEGTLIKESPQVIGPKAGLFIRPGSSPFYTMPDAGWIEVVGFSGQELSGYQYLSSSAKAESLFALKVDSAQKIVPHIPPPGYWITSVTLINPHDRQNRVIFHLTLAGEDHGDDLEITLSPREKRTVELQDQFGMSEEDPLFHSLLEIEGEYPLAGYYTFRTPLDEASFPLLDENDFKDQLVLPHSAVNEFWWTGVGIVNPTSFVETVRIEPYDNNGNLMESMVGSLNLNSGAYQVMLVSSLFGARASEVSFIKFRVNGPGAIGGFYLYGTSANEMLSGANM